LVNFREGAKDVAISVVLRCKLSPFPQRRLVQESSISTIESGGGGCVCGKKLWGASRLFSPIWFMDFEDILSYFGDEMRFLRISWTISHRVLFVFHRSY
jgi:hypothetical protein